MSELTMRADRQEQAASRTAAGARGSGMLAALHAEWTKVRTVSGPAWLLLGIAALTTGVGLAAVGGQHCPASMQCPVDPTKLSLTGIQFAQAVVAILAVLTICNEFSTGMIRVTLAAMPRRVQVLGAKAILVAGLVLVAGALGALGSVLAGQLILPGHGFTTARGFEISLSYGPTLRAAAGSVLYLALIALLSLGIAAMIRDSAVSIGAVLGVLYIFPIMLAFASNSVTWQHRLERWTPTLAGLAIQATTGARSLAISPWDGLGVLAIWAGAALVAGAVVFRFRDA
jgi:ABC-2 type transport system permease protein